MGGLARRAPSVHGPFFLQNPVAFLVVSFGVGSCTGKLKRVVGAGPGPAEEYQCQPPTLFGRHSFQHWPRFVICWHFISAWANAGNIIWLPNVFLTLPALLFGPPLFSTLSPVWNLLVFVCAGAKAGNTVWLS